MADDMPDKNFLYGVYEAGEKRRQRLAHKVAAKALDMDAEDMNIDASKSGIGSLGAIGIAVAAGLPSMLLAAFMAWQAMQPSQTAAPPAAPTTGEHKEEFDLGFWQENADGTFSRIDVERLPQKK